MSKIKLEQAIKSADCSAVRVILSKKNNNLKFAVCLAAQLGQAQILDLLLNELKGDPNSQFEDKQALLEAIHMDYLDCVELLLEAGADPNMRYKFGPILCKAANRGFIQDGEAAIVKLLVQHGADANLANDFHETAMDVATIRFRNDAVRLQAIKNALTATPINTPSENLNLPMMLLNKEVVSGVIADLPFEFTIEQLATALKNNKGAVTDLNQKTNLPWQTGLTPQKFAEGEARRPFD